MNSSSDLRSAPINQANDQVPNWFPCTKRVMEEMRGCRFALQRGYLLVVTHNRITGKTSWHSIRYVGSVLVGKPVPTFWRKCSNDGPKKVQCRPSGDRWMELTDDDVLEILKLFEQSTFDFLQLEQGERRITISKGGYGSPKREPDPAASERTPAAVAKPAASSASASQTTASAAAAVA